MYSNLLEAEDPVCGSCFQNLCTQHTTNVISMFKDTFGCSSVEDCVLPGLEPSFRQHDKKLQRPAMH